MDTNVHFKVIFTKLQESIEKTQEQGAQIRIHPLEVTPEELNEFEALRRIVLEITEPEPTFFTTT